VRKLGKRLKETIGFEGGEGGRGNKRREKQGGLLATGEVTLLKLVELYGGGHKKMRWKITTREYEGQK